MLRALETHVNSERPNIDNHRNKVMHRGDHNFSRNDNLSIEDTKDGLIIDKRDKKSLHFESCESRHRFD